MACILKPIPDSSDFEGPTGKTVTLVTADHIGSVMFAKAEYAGESFVPDGQAVSEISFPIVAGRKTVKMVFVFTASTAGIGELREDASPDSQFLRSLMGSEPFQAMRITGK